MFAKKMQVLIKAPILINLYNVSLQSLCFFFILIRMILFKKAQDSILRVQFWKILQGYSINQGLTDVNKELYDNNVADQKKQALLSRKSKQIVSLKPSLSKTICLLFRSS